MDLLMHVQMYVCMYVCRNECMYDSTKYDTKRMDPIKMITCNLWLSRGKPINDNQNPILNDASNEPLTEFPLPPSCTTAADISSWKDIIASFIYK